MGFVIARQRQNYKGVVYMRGRPVRDDDPFVKANPHLFMSIEEAAGVEDATATPGSKRSTRRSTAKKATED